MSLRDRLFWEDQARKLGWKIDKHGALDTRKRKRPGASAPSLVKVLKRTGTKFTRRGDGTRCGQ